MTDTRLHRLAGLLAMVCVLFAVPLAAPLAARDGALAVDAELVIAVDVSYSMDQEEQRLQRAGYVEALSSREFQDALKSGVQGKVAIAYMEWAGSADQETIMPWTLVDSPEAAKRFADILTQIPLRRDRRTSISGGIDAAARMFVNNGFAGTRQIIDVSGDGPNNAGRPVTQARDAAVAAGIIINGLPLVDIRPYTSPVDIKELDIYYAECVIGGPGAFMIPVNSTQKFIDATRTKLVLEISMRMPAPQPIIQLANAAVPRISCLIGEKLWKTWTGE